MIEILESRLSQLSESALELIMFWDKRHFPTPWKENAWRDSLRNDSYWIFRASSHGNLLGVALFKKIEGDEVGHLLKILTDPPARKKRLGTELLNFAIESMRQKGASRIFLEVSETNHSAIAFYRHMKFVQIHVSKHFYGAGEDALIFEKSLLSEALTGKE
ncbi:MAG: GNAT family N-acetyltransferase [Bacteriovoracaceae bacterium]|jgi:[ribosomal protein S18]-alanine N-acetyltransferase|nr:GNAT family N-acetyltransferase [Bacteriovoracaceae bacterium]